MRILGTLLATVLAFAVMAPAVFLAVFLLAGPHGGALPQALHGAALAAGWVVVMVVPAMAGRWAWRRLAPAQSG